MLWAARRKHNVLCLARLHAVLVCKAWLMLVTYCALPAILLPITKRQGYMRNAAYCAF